METIIPKCHNCAKIKVLMTYHILIVYCQKQIQLIAAQAVTKYGVLQPTQLLYQGLTDKCHPNYYLPIYWDEYHIENNRSNAETINAEIS